MSDAPPCPLEEVVYAMETRASLPLWVAVSYDAPGGLRESWDAYCSPSAVAHIAVRAGGLTAQAALAAFTRALPTDRDEAWACDVREAEYVSGGEPMSPQGHAFVVDGLAYDFASAAQRVGLVADYSDGLDLACDVLRSVAPCPPLAALVEACRGG